MKLFLSDFDETLVSAGVLDAVASINGIENASEKLYAENIAANWGIAPLVNLINSLKGITRAQIKKKLDENNFLAKGAKELFSWLKQNGYTTVLHTGNILPVAEYYKDLLGIDYIVCAMPKMDGDKIVGITEKDIVKGFKAKECKKIIDKLKIPKENIVAIGDSAVDLPVFELAGVTIAINAKGGIEKHATYEIKNGDLAEVIKIV
ncbi:MAG: HAD-IB family phosphatase [Firmicutes bacterium]|nr:HAD-IB family phosphatase [Bacillota bacterium]